MESLFPMFLGAEVVAHAAGEVAEEEIVKQEEPKIDSDRICSTLLSIAGEIMMSKLAHEVDALVVKFMDIFLLDFGKWDSSAVFAKMKESEFEECLKEVFCEAIKRSTESKSDLERLSSWMVATDISLGGHLDSLVFHCTIK